MLSFLSEARKPDAVANVDQYEKLNQKFPVLEITLIHSVDVLFNECVTCYGNPYIISCDNAQNTFSQSSILLSHHQVCRKPSSLYSSC